ncbi:carboxymuconolactone decarboxylase family protein [Snodgrassella communis]|uniref:carboxymuconolactone decarboxylase family protein n=1 Tax=Snodgrassella communis TaxID=2946699 RepID=UPI001EF62CF0|nr:carboxymuconolactone decarboxylase family protein [Snodgrassella communis]
MSNYQSPDDIKYVASLLNLAPQEARAFIEFDHQTVKREDGLIPIKTREFIALAVALTTQCAYCIDIHTKGAMRAGASKQELAELISVAASVRAGATMGHGLLALRLLDELKY